MKNLASFFTKIALVGFLAVSTGVTSSAQDERYDPEGRIQAADRRADEAQVKANAERAAALRGNSKGGSERGGFTESYESREEAAERYSKKLGFEAIKKALGRSAGHPVVAAVTESLRAESTSTGADLNSTEGTIQHLNALARTETDSERASEDSGNADRFEGSRDEIGSLALVQDLTDDAQLRRIPFLPNARSHDINGQWEYSFNGDPMGVLNVFHSNALVTANGIFSPDGETFIRFYGEGWIEGGLYDFKYIIAVDSSEKSPYQQYQNYRSRHSGEAIEHNWHHGLAGLSRDGTIRGKVTHVPDGFETYEYILASVVANRCSGNCYDRFGN